MSDDARPQVDDSEFLDIARDPAEARLLRKALQQLAGGGAGDALKEMAQEVLSGRVGLREAVGISAYSDVLSEKAAAFTAEWGGKTEAEREAMAAEGRQLVEQQRQEIEAERRQAQQQSGKPSRHDGHGWSAY